MGKGLSFVAPCATELRRVKMDNNQQSLEQGILLVFVLPKYEPRLTIVALIDYDLTDLIVFFHVIFNYFTSSLFILTEICITKRPITTTIEARSNAVTGL